MGERIDHEDRFGKLVGAILITEGVLVAISRLLTMVYLLAREAYASDGSRVPLTTFLPWLLVSGLVIAVLLWAGSLLRRTSDGAWRAAGIAARIDLVLAGVLNTAAVGWAFVGLLRTSAPGLEARGAWLLLAATSATVVVGIVRDAAFLVPRRGSV